MAYGGPISGNDFHWYLIKEHREFMEKALVGYLNYEASEEDQNFNKPWWQRCWINAKAKFEISMRKKRMVRVFYNWAGQLNFKNAHAGGGCPMVGYNLNGTPVSEYSVVPDRVIKFYFYNGKRFEPGDNRACNFCVNQINCYTQGNPTGYFESIENVKRSKKLKTSA